jgi:hypothetical protein
MAEAVNGIDFAPFHEGLFIKDAGLGAAVSWHQDGDTHWDNPNLIKTFTASTLWARSMAVLQ